MNSYSVNKSSFNYIIALDEQRRDEMYGIMVVDDMDEKPYVNKE